MTRTERAERGSYAGCIAGALSFGEFADGLVAAGLDEVSITATHAAAPGIYSAIVKATKPAIERAAPTPPRVDKRAAIGGLVVVTEAGCC